MSNIEDFLTLGEEHAIVQAIRKAEAKTSGEIRVHIERETTIDVLERAKIVFHGLKMDNTKLQNGVLIYVAVNSKQFAICGDRGIDAVVPKNFWESTKTKIANQFKQGQFKQGLIDGVTEAGKQLQQHFPWHHNDSNELPNTISKGNITGD